MKRLKISLVFFYRLKVYIECILCKILRLIYNLFLIKIGVNYESEFRVI
jgi:hypothetical protein